MDLTKILTDYTNGIYGEELKRISQVNKYYQIYEGTQRWKVAEGLDYKPTQKITNIIKRLINTKARYLFGEPLEFTLEGRYGMQELSDQEKEKLEELVELKEDLLNEILKANNFNRNILQAKRDCSIGGRVAIKLWASKEEGIKIIFSPAQEFIPVYDADDLSKLEKITYLYTVKDGNTRGDQRINRQTWEMIDGLCMLTEELTDGNGKLIQTITPTESTGLDFIPSIVIKNGGLTGETIGQSDVAVLWDNQDQYNKLTSDDIDSLKFQMFGQDVATDASEESLQNMIIAPGALVDLQTDEQQGASGRQARLERLESNFSYKEKFTDTIERIKSDMYEDLSVPNVSIDKLQGVVTSGKGMETLYWEAITVAKEEWLDWEAGLEALANYMFKMIETYGAYEGHYPGLETSDLVAIPTVVTVARTFPLPKDTQTERKEDREDVIAGLLSRKEYLRRWGQFEDVDGELMQILKEKQQFEGDVYEQDLLSGLLE